MEILVVLQTHSRGDSQSWLGKKRYCGAPKAEVTRRCVSSLIRSMNLARSKIHGSVLRLQVFDDHSDPEVVEQLQEILEKASFPTEFKALSTFGIMPSIMACYQHGLNYGRQWVYFAQDDYLYDPRAISQMLLVSREFSTYTGQPISIYPFDDPYRYYKINNGEKVNIVRGVDRHWRTNYHTASCFMTHHSIIQANWDLFSAMGTSPLSDSMEDDTINQLFISRHYVLFTPIPSLALHVQYEREHDPFIDWKAWWVDYEPQRTFDNLPGFEFNEERLWTRNNL